MKSAQTERAELATSSSDDDHRHRRGYGDVENRLKPQESDGPTKISKYSPPYNIRLFVSCVDFSAKNGGFGQKYVR